MYYKEEETNAAYKAAKFANMQKQARARLDKVRKLKNAKKANQPKQK